MEEYLLLNANEPQLSFDELSPELMDQNQHWEYQVRPFYTIICPCPNVEPSLITMILTSDCFNPLQIHHEIWRLYINSGLDWFKEENIRTELNPVSLLSTLAASKHQSQLSRIINKHNVNDSFPSSTDWPYYRLTDTYMRPSIGWSLRKYHHDAEKNLFGKSIFTFLSQSDVRDWERENLNTLLDNRYRVMKPLIARGHDVNLHASDLYVWWLNDPSSFTNILGEIFADGLMNLHSTTHLSPSMVLLMVAWAYRWSWNWNWDTVPPLVRLVHVLVADWQE